MWPCGIRRCRADPCWHSASATPTMPEDRFTISPDEQFGAIRLSESLGHSIGAIFHSHPHSDAYPSELDIGGGADPELAAFHRWPCRQASVRCSGHIGSMAAKWLRFRSPSSNRLADMARSEHNREAYRVLFGYVGGGVQTLAALLVLMSFPVIPLWLFVGLVVFLAA